MRELKRLDVWIDDASLRGVDDRINIVDIHEDAPETELTWGDIPGRHGQRLLSRVRKSLKVGIEFDIRELFDVARRAEIVGAVNAWAADGVLKVSHRPGQRLRVFRSSAAAINAARDVTGTYTVEFQATASPFWEDETPTTLTMTGTGQTLPMLIPGNVTAVPEITVKPTGGALATLSLGFGGTSMSFTSLAVARNDVLKITHDENGWLVIAVGSTNKMSKRDAESADDFEAQPGRLAQLSFSSSVACEVTWSVRGRYL